MKVEYHVCTFRVATDLTDLIQIRYPIINEYVLLRALGNGDTGQCFLPQEILPIHHLPVVRCVISIFYSVFYRLEY